MFLPSPSADVASAVRDPERLAAVRGLVLLDTGPSPGFDRLARLTARILRSPIALVTLVDSDRQYFKAAYGLPEELTAKRETPLEWSFCQFTVALRTRLVVCDARVEHWLDDNPAVSQFGVRAYAGVPLITGDGHAVGALCVLDIVPRDWTDEDLANLEDLAAVALREIRLHRLEKQVAHLREARRS